MNKLLLILALSAAGCATTPDTLYTQTCHQAYHSDGTPVLVCVPVKTCRSADPG